MDASYALHGHASSVSSLLTILPLSLDAAEWPISSKQLTPRHVSDLGDAVQVPLPPSAPESEHDGISRDPEKEAISELVIADVPDELRIPLPPSPSESEHNHGVSVPNHIENPSLPCAGERVHQSASTGSEARNSTTFPANSSNVVGAPATPETFSGLMRMVRRAHSGRSQVLAFRKDTVQLLHVCAANYRLVSLQSHLYKRMVEAFRLEKKTSFASLLSLSERLEAEASLNSGSPGVLQDLESPHLLPLPKSEAPWLYDLPSRSQSAILRFLNSLRNEPSFLADRLSYLTAPQLLALAKPYRHLTSTESQGETTSPLSRLNPRHALRNRKRTVDIPNMEDLSRDPLRLLILNCFDANSPLDSKERARQLDVWSSACARVLEDGSHGSSEFCLAVLDIFAECSSWAVRPKLELFLLELMHSGVTASDLPHSTAEDSLATGSGPRQISPSAAEFMDSVVQSLLSLITSMPAGSGVPFSALSLIRATMQKLGNSRIRTKARDLFVFGWFCTTYLANALVFPERHHMFLKTHVSTHTREKLFLELAYKMRAVISDFSASRLPVNSPLADAITSLIKLFIAPSVDYQSRSQSSTSDQDRLFTVLYAEDVLSIAKALYPDNSPNPDRGDKIGVFSTASSVTGSSTLTGGTDEGGLGAISSFTPSLSGTSVTSHTFSNDILFQSDDGLHISAIPAPVTPLRSRPTTANGLSPASAKIPIQDFLPDLWKMCSSRKSSLSRDQNADASLFFIDNSDGHLSFRASRSSQGDIDLQAAPPDAAYTPPASESIAYIMNALAQCSTDQIPSACTEGYANSDILKSIVMLFKHQHAACKSAHEFASAHIWFRALQAISLLASDFQRVALPEIASRLSASYDDSESKVDLYRDWLFALQGQRKTQIRKATHLQTGISTLQAKMWYITDVRYSSAYEQAANIGSALKSMRGAQPAKKQGVTAWAKQRFRVSFGHEKTQAQFLELLSAPKHCGGPNKLTDEQAEITSRWLTQESIENFCRGEERMHRFCLEVRKCAASLVGNSMLDSPVLWSSILYGGRSDAQAGISSSHGNLVLGVKKPLRKPMGFPEMTTFDADGVMRYTSNTPNVAAGGLGFTFNTQNVRDQLANTPGTYQPSPRSPTIREPQSPLAVYPNGQTPSRAQALNGTKMPTEELRQIITSLLISDLGYELWTQGSETDIWFNGEKSPIAAASKMLAQTTFDAKSAISQSPPVGPENTDDPSQHLNGREAKDALIDLPVFDFAEGYDKLLKKFKLSSDPVEKLQALYELSLLAECQCSAMQMADESYQGLKSRDKSMFARSSLYDQRMSRVRLTRLEEVVANCEERRRGSIASLADSQFTAGLSLHAFGGNSSAYDISNALVLVSSLFVDKDYRPSTLFRDLQLIASFVPSTVLDRTPRGTVFWTVGLVAMSLKAETCRMMTNQATEIVNYHLNSSNHREPIRADHKAQSDQSQEIPCMQVDELSSSQLADAARLYMLSALEGEPAAARELALFYLTHPELVRYVMLPLSKPGEVAKSSLLSGVSSDRRRERSGVLDPQTFAIAYHWMEFAANAGDADAQTFLRENSDLGQGL